MSAPADDAVKDALDPDGILSPGKQGIWPGAAGVFTLPGGSP